jgi:hypothetical protein
MPSMRRGDEDRRVYQKKDVVEKNLRHCDLWQGQEPHPPPKATHNQLIPSATVERSILDFNFTSTRLSAGFERNWA